MPLPEHQKKSDVHLFSHCTIIGQTDRIDKTMSCYAFVFFVLIRDNKNILQTIKAQFLSKLDVTGLAPHLI